MEQASGSAPLGRQVTMLGLKLYFERPVQILRHVGD